MSRLTLSLLGSPRLAYDETPIELNRRKAVALIAYLAVTGETHSRDRLATLLWPEYDQSRARAALRSNLWALNKTPLKARLSVDQETIGLHLDPNAWLDTAHFHRLLASCEEHDHPTSDVCSACLPLLTEAVALYRDDFLSGFTLTDSPEFDGWQLFQTESLRQELVDALAKLVQGFARQGEFKPAIEFARRWLALDPLHEPAHRQLMQLYAWSGDRAAALRQYDECVQLFEEELGLPPDAETMALYEQIRTGAGEQRSKGARVQRRSDAGEISPPLPSSPAPPLRHNLPARTTPFIGREIELTELARFLDDPAIRLVTILSPGGMGKTRLALELATTQLERFSHGVYFVPLGPLDSSEVMVATIAEALDFSFYEGSTPQQQLLDYLRQKSLLLILDNFEHLLSLSQSPPLDTGRVAATELVADILRVAPAVKVLVTSRERLKLSGETVFTLEGMDFPTDVEQPPSTPEGTGNSPHRGKDAVPSPPLGGTEGGLAAQYSAIKLFVQTARQVRPDFDPAGDEWQSISQICRLVQGMPLGLLLAAAWVELLSPEDIATEIKQNLDFLATDLRDVPERQRSLRAVFNHSWQLLPAPDRAVFEQLSIFRGGFTREAAEAVTGVSLRGLMTLVNKALLQRASAGRYQVHELLRQYGAEKLAGDPTRQTNVRDRHCAYYCAFLHQRQADLKGARQQSALVEIETDLENVRVAWAWAIDHGQIETIESALESLYEFYHIRSRFQEGYDDFGRTVARIQTETQKSGDADGGVSEEIVLTRLLARQGAFGVELGHYDVAGNLLQQTLALARRLDVPWEKAFCLNALGDIRREQGALLEAEQRYQDSLAISQVSGDPLAQAASLEKWGFMKIMQGNYDQAYRLSQQSLNIYREVEHPFGMATLLNQVALAAWQMGQYPEAERLWTESLTISKELGSRLGEAKALGGLGFVAWGLGRAKLTQAKQLFQERLAIISELGHPIELGDSFCWLAYILNDLGEYQTARKYALETLAISNRIGNTWNISCSLSLLSETAAGLKDFQAAWSHIYEALEIGAKLQDHPPILIALVNLAFLLANDTDRLKKEAVFDEETASTKSNEQAIEILTLVMNHPATWQVFKDKAVRLRTELEAELPAEVIAAAIERGKARDLSETVAELLEELSKPSESELFRVPAVANNLPPQPTPFIGRESELIALDDFLADPAVRLVTIVGPGGIGKTRLALAAAERQLTRPAATTPPVTEPVPHFPHGVFFVSLAPLSSADHIVPTVAETLNFNFYEGGTPRQQLLDYLREKRLLLILDNFEHLLTGVELLTAILQTAPGVQILVTSRERLQLQQEQLYPLQGLEFPAKETPTEAVLPPQAGPQDAAEYSAVQLFLQSARRIQPDFELRAEESTALTSICRLVEGMPLGLELAAAWADILPLADIAAEIQHSLDFLEREGRDVPERHRSMRAVFDTSWQKLNPAEKEGFAQLSVFRGGFTRSAARQVTGVSLRTLAALMKKSVMRYSNTRDRYEIHELLRQYGVEKLAEDPTRHTDIRDRHCAFYCARLGQREADLRGARQQAALAQIEADLENVRLAWAWAIEHSQFEAIEQALESLYEFYHIRSRFQEGHDDFGRAVARIQAETQQQSDADGGISEIVLTRLLARQGAFGVELGRYEATGDLLQQGLALARRCEAPREIAFCLNLLGGIAQTQGNYSNAKKLRHESLTISEEIDDKVTMAEALYGLSHAASEQGEFIEAKRYIQGCLALYREVKHQTGIVHSIDRVALSVFMLGNHTEAQQYWQESLVNFQEIGDWLGIAKTLGGLTLVALVQGGPKLVEAESLAEQGLAAIREIGNKPEVAFHLYLMGIVANSLRKYHEAQQYCQEALAMAKEFGSSNSITLPLTCLGEAACGQGDFKKARQYLYEALRDAVNNRRWTAALAALEKLAVLWVKENYFSAKDDVAKDRASIKQGQKEQALEILALVITHPATWPLTRSQAARLGTELEAELPPEAVLAARERGQSSTLEEVVAELLDEK